MPPIPPRRAIRMVIACYLAWSTALSCGPGHTAIARTTGRPTMQSRNPAAIGGIAQASHLQVGSPARPAARAARIATGTTPSPLAPNGTPQCLGLNDLNVQAGGVILSGKHTYDRVCVVDGGTLILGGAVTLHAGLVFVDAHSAINGDPPSVLNGNCGQNGAPGASLAIVARAVVVRGPITVNGGSGNGIDCTLGHVEGGAGGHISIETQSLTITAPLKAAGGDAGWNSNGGRGGIIQIAVPDPAAIAIARLVDVHGGQAWPAKDLNPNPLPGAAGSLAIRTLDQVQQAALPPPPAPILGALGPPPSRLAPVPDSTFTQGMACGPSDLDIGSGRRVRLSGVHRYAHVCIHDGGQLQAAVAVSLIAQTIVVGAGSSITADAVVLPTSSPPATGHYTDGGAAAWRGAAPHPGVPGPTGLDSDPDTEGNTSPGPAGGAGGGGIALIAQRVLLAGTVSARGGAGGNGDPGQIGFRTENYYGTGDAGGGSGGGILVAAGILQLTGAISVAGGNPGHGGEPRRDQPHGSPGAVRLLVSTLYAAPGDLPVEGPGVLGQRLPVDPVPSASGGRYFPATSHTLGGAFLAAWTGLGGLDALGLPLTEPFTDGTTLVQYTERAELVLAGGSVHLAPLGRALTAGRSFPPVQPSPASATVRYFAATGHSLSGAFLQYWQMHQGPALLGPPISQPVFEGNGDESGRRYNLQWFVSGRLEFHPEQKDSRYQIQLGLLGRAALQQRGWLAPLTP